MKARELKTAPETLDLLERGVALLRGAPMKVWAAYLVGTAPFALGLLYFFGEMSHGAYAQRHCAAQSIGLGALYIWMKCWQSCFCVKLREHLTGHRPAPWSVKRIAGLIAVQGAVQPWGLVLVPATLLIVAPFAWVFAFFQNLSALGGETGGARATMRQAGSLAELWPARNHLLLLILATLGLFMWLNVMSALFLIPFLLKTLLGIETIFTVGGMSAYFNSTVLMASLVISYFCVDPLVKAAYLLRCFHGSSLASAEDLKVELAGLRRVAAIAALVLCVWSAGSARGAEAPPLSPTELNQSIEKALKRDEFTWRMPREKMAAPDSQKNWLARFADDTALAIREGGKWVADTWRTVRDWLDRLWPDSHRSESGNGGRSSTDWASMLRALIAILIIAICCLIAILLMRSWKQRWRGEVVVAEAAPARPDLADENLVASQLPEEGWLKLAAELLQRGDLRLALRAYYLASLAHLGAREMIAIAIFKSNRDYEKELRWRSRALTDLHAAFSENGAIFDRVWYGLHEVTQEALGQFQSNLERIRGC
jgi:hypothetical protein